MQSVLGDLLNDKGANRHIRTLIRDFQCDMNKNETAASLQIHRNTVVHRLERISEISGYNPENIEEAFSLRLAIEIYNQLDGSMK